MLKSITMKGTPGADWDDFISRHLTASLYLLSGWTLIAKEAFGHEVWFLEARDEGGALIGVLPVIHQRSAVFGNFATSVAFYNYGGPATTDAVVARKLMDSACEIARERGCEYLEFRDTQERAGDWEVRTDKVTMTLKLPKEVTQLTSSFGAKLRAQIKRPEREGVNVRLGGADLIGDFYNVFAENMRDLGTPVYPRRFFSQVFHRYNDLCRVLVVDCQGIPGAAAIITKWRERAEVPWAGCRRRFKGVGLNMRLYWELLCASVQAHCDEFDFGRCSIGSGTYRFKEQWGATARPLYWYRWTRNRQPQGAETATANRVRRLGQYIWQMLPLSIANIIGPTISGNLPW